MNTKERYTKLFTDTFPFSHEAVATMSFQQTEGWDSVGHITLVTSIEDHFSIRLTPSEIFSFRSFAQGLDILTQKGIDFTI